MWKRFVLLTIAPALCSAFGVGCDARINLDDPLIPTDDVGTDIDVGISGCVKLGCPLRTLHCEVTSGKCVACLQDDHCEDSPETRRCDIAQHRCVPCGNEGDCLPGDTCIQRRCVHKCSEAIPCPEDEEICEKTRRFGGELREFCIRCRTDRECASDRDEPFCEATFGRCVACLRDTNCPMEKPICDPFSHRCVECAGDVNCSSKLCDLRRMTCVR